MLPFLFETPTCNKTVSFTDINMHHIPFTLNLFALVIFTFFKPLKYPFSSSVQTLKLLRATQDTPTQYLLALFQQFLNTVTSETL